MDARLDLRLATIAAAIALAPLQARAAPADTRTPEAIAVQTALERVCLPLLDGKTVKQVAERSGLRSDAQGWFLTLPGAERLSLQPPGGANPTICTFSVTFPVDRPQPILALLDLWARDHQLTAAAVGRRSQGPSEQRWTWSWQGAAPVGAVALVFDTEKTLDGRPVTPPLDRATVLVSRTNAA